MIMIALPALVCLPGNLFVFAQSVIKLFKELFHRVSRLFLKKKWKKHVVAKLGCNAVFCGFFTFSFQGHNIFANLSSKEYSDLMQLLKQSILATDLTLYFE